MTYIKIMSRWQFWAVAIIWSFVFSPVSNAHSTINLPKNGAFSVTCKDGTLSNPTNNGTVWQIKCVAAEGPPKPPVGPPPDKPCTAMKIGQEIMKLSGYPVVRCFNTKNYPKGTYISWGPHSASSFPVLVVKISKTMGDIEIPTTQAERLCFSGAPTGGMTATLQGPCKLDPNTQYFVNIWPGNPNTGKFQCSGACELTFFNSKK